MGSVPPLGNDPVAVEGGDRHALICVESGELREFQVYAVYKTLTATWTIQCRRRRFGEQHSDQLTVQGSLTAAPAGLHLFVGANGVPCLAVTVTGAAYIAFYTYSRGTDAWSLKGMFVTAGTGIENFSACYIEESGVPRYFIPHMDPGARNYVTCKLSGNLIGFWTSITWEAGTGSYPTFHQGRRITCACDRSSHVTVMWYSMATRALRYDRRASASWSGATTLYTVSSSNPLDHPKHLSMHYHRPASGSDHLAHVAMVLRGGSVTKVRVVYLPPVTATTWGLAELVVPDTPIHDQDMPSIAVNHDGAVYLCWRSEGGLTGARYFSTVMYRREPGGGWSAVSHYEHGSGDVVDGPHQSGQYSFVGKSWFAVGTSWFVMCSDGVPFFTTGLDPIPEVVLFPFPNSTVLLSQVLAHYKGPGTKPAQEGRLRLIGSASASVERAVSAWNNLKLSGTAEPDSRRVASTLGFSGVASAGGIFHLSAESTLGLSGGAGRFNPLQCETEWEPTFPLSTDPEKHTYTLLKGPYPDNTLVVQLPIPEFNNVLEVDLNVRDQRTPGNVLRQYKLPHDTPTLIHRFIGLSNIKLIEVSDFFTACAGRRFMYYDHNGLIWLVVLKQSPVEMMATADDRAGSLELHMEGSIVGSTEW